MKKSPQFLPRIKVYLLQGKALTPQIALKLWKCYRLASYINRLRNMGFNIVTDIVYNKNGTSYAKYSIK